MQAFKFVRTLNFLVYLLAWNAWVNQNCKSMCCGGLSSNKKYQENRTCSNANINLCPSDAHGRNLTRDKDCPTCVNGDCSFSKFSFADFMQLL